MFQNTFNILALSGGGIKGIFQATFLNLLEERYEFPLYDVFDLVAGTSTGSIVGAALACGIRMEKVVDLYKKDGNAIFRGKHLKYIRHSWYSSENLQKKLSLTFGNTCLNEAKTKLLIPSTSLENYKHNIFTQDSNTSMVDALMSSAAAPFYFDAYRASSNVDHYFLDGGLWANNPTLLSVLYCVNELDIPVDRIRVLSLGTQCIPPGEQARQYNSLRTFNPSKIKNVISAMFNSSESFSKEYSEDLIHSKNIIHINPSDSVRSEIELDEVSKAIDELPGIADTVFKEKISVVLDLLGYEGRCACSLKRKDFIKEEAILRSGLADFVPTRKNYRESDKDSSIESYLFKATSSIRIMSVSLSNAILYHDLERVLESLLKRNKALELKISLLNPDNLSLIKVMAPILNLSEETLRSNIKKSVESLFRLCKNNKKIQIYLHNTIPFGTVIAVDEKKDTGSIILETKPYKTAITTSFSCRLLNSENSVLFKNIMEGCYNIEKESQKMSKKILSKWKS